MKNFFSFCISLALLIGVLPVANAASFDDVNRDHNHYRAIEYLRSAGYVQGYSDGQFKPESSVSRAEFLKIVLEAAGYRTEGNTISEGYKLGGSNCFSDVNDEWFAPYVCTAKENGYVSGYADGTFKPGKTVSFAEAAKIITEVLGLDTEPTETSIWYKPYVLSLQDVHAIPKRIDSFGKIISRGEAAEMVWRIKTKNASETSNTYDNIVLGKEAKDNEDYPGTELVTFNSCEELKAEIEKATGDGYYYERGVGVLMEEGFADAEAVGAATDDAVMTKSAEAPSSNGDYSETNVQVEGVDEADIVKTDGEYIYLVKGNNIRVVSAYPPKEMEEVDSVTFTDETFYPSEMYVSDQKLVVVGSSYDWNVNGEEDEEVKVVDSANEEKELGYYVPRYTYGTKVYIFDISDPEDVKEKRQVMVEGDYISSRRIDNRVYLATSTYRYPVYRYGALIDEAEGSDDESAEVVTPLFYDSAKTEEVETACGCGSVLYPEYLPPESFLTLVAIPTDDINTSVNKKVILGGGTTVYSSKSNFYVASPYWKYDYWGDSDETVIHKFALAEGINYVGSGTVPGNLLNQFSMDEYDGDLRVATTSDSWSRGKSDNNVYVLDENLDVKGKLEGLAEGERIYSVRFMGKRAYMVTFVRIDPLFVIDLSDPEKPEVLGELKIPGVSDYLHPLDENHLIGFGVEAPTEEESEEMGWTWFEGLKISMFDVSDVDNPKEIHKVVLGDRGSTTPLRYNHKALLFDAERGIMALPVTINEIPEELKEDSETPDWQYGNVVFQGAYVYDVSVEDGFDLRGKISHYSDTTFEEISRSYWNEPRDIQRIVRIGEYLYSVSEEVLSSWKLSNLDEIKMIELRIKE